MLSALLLTTLLSINDPHGDVGINELEPPSSTVFRNLDAFDLLGLNIPDEPTFSFELKFKRLSNPWSLEFGFSLPIIEVYVEVPNQPTDTTILPGSGMSLPRGERWSHVFKLTGDGLNIYAPRQGKVVDITNEIKAVLSIKDNTLVITTNLPLNKNITLYGIVGSYDPFTPDGWRVLSEEASAWAFSSGTYKLPVLDVLATNDSLQKQALKVGILPRLEVKPSPNPWTYLTIVGTILVIIGLAMRFWLSKANPKRATSSKVTRKKGLRVDERKATQRARQRATTRQPSEPITLAKPKKAQQNFDFESPNPNWFEKIDSDMIFTLGEAYSESMEGENKNVTWDFKEGNSSHTTIIDDFKNVQKETKEKEVVLKSDSKSAKKADS